MKKRKKIIALVLSITMAAVSLMGCASTDGDKKTVVNSGDKAGDVSNKNEAGSDTEENGVESTTEEKADSDQASKMAEVTIQEQVLIDEGGIKITAIEYETDSIWGDGIKLLIENDTDKDYTIGCDALIVNDYMISDLFVADIAAGKKANETMHLSTSELEAAGIDVVGKIEMYFHAYDSDWDNLFQNEYCEIETSEFANMDTTPNDEGAELYNADGIRIVGKTVDENSFWGTAILLYIENTSGRNVGISVDDVSINGFMMEPFFSTTVYDGKKAIDDITIFSSDLEDNGIESIEQVELKFHIYDADSYDTITDSDVITFSAE